MAWRSVASSSRGCRRLASFSASPVSSTISLEPLFNCFSAAQASSFTEPMPRRESSVSWAVSQDASSSSPARMMDPVAPIRKWHQVILDLSVSTSPSWNLCSSSANQSDNTCCRWSYLLMRLTMEFVVAFCLNYSDSKCAFTYFSF